MGSLVSLQSAEGCADTWTLHSLDSHLTGISSHKLITMYSSQDGWILLHVAYILPIESRSTYGFWRPRLQTVPDHSPAICHWSKDQRRYKGRWNRFLLFYGENCKGTIKIKRDVGKRVKGILANSWPRYGKTQSCKTIFLKRYMGSLWGILLLEKLISNC
jgi:hypothetical protein